MKVFRNDLITDDRLINNLLNLPCGILLFRKSESNNILYANEELLNICECSNTEQFINLTHYNILSLIVEDDYNKIKDQMLRYTLYSDLNHFEFRIKTKYNNTKYVDMFISENDDNEIGHYYTALITAVSEQYDPLTKLATMSFFLDNVGKQECFEYLKTEIPAMIAFNFNGLKHFNTEYGINAGNQLLMEFADILKQHFGQQNCSRFGEDNFYAFAPSSNLTEHIDQISNEVKRLNYGNSLSIRVGIYIYKLDKMVPASIACDRARIACDYNRKVNESTIRYYNDEIHDEILNRDYILSNLDKSLEAGYIKVYYQPQVTLEGRMHGFEALARWEDPVHGLMSPGIFIPVLEDYNLTYKIDLYLIEQIAKHMVIAKENNIPIMPVSFNLSRTDFIKVNIYEYLNKIVKQYDLKKDYFKIEITESTVMYDPDAIIKAIKNFRSHGYEVLMDDFGNAYSSLSTLREFDFDEIKIDMGFMRHFNKKSKAILEPIITMANNLGIKTLVEGVETEEQLEFLKTIGCDFIQGYYFGKPEPFENAIDRGIKITEKYFKDNNYRIPLNVQKIIDKFEIKETL